MNEVSEVAIEIEDRFDRFGWKWNVKDRGLVRPDRYDFQAALDEAERVMYPEVVGTVLEVGRLVFIKQASGLDVYVMAGTIESKNNIGEE